LSVPLALWLLFFLLAGCVGPGQEEEKKSAPPVAGSFVGEMPDVGEDGTFVAVVASGAAEEGAELEVRAYLCGEEVNEWFWSSVAGNDLELSSDSGWRLEGQLTSDAASGTITPPDSASVPFEASPATGIAGLYDVTLSADGQLSGSSERGGRIEGQIADRAQGDDYPISSTITPPEGQPQDFELLASSNAPADFRLIALADGRIKVGGQISKIVSE
jgi:hypothetical protein